MEELKSGDFMKKETMVYGCGVENKTARGYHKATQLEESDVRLIGMRTKAPISQIKMQSESSK